ncbi:MAG: alanyl-tRNA editing protein [Dorea sp.]|nr:alanyl-tRNA editing protein [Dorea sp.]
MKATEKLFYEDSHLNEFDAVVCSCRPDGERYRVVLDRTAFFPEGGGQYADTGTLDGIKVEDVREKENVVYHITEAPLEEGVVVHGRINWEERFGKMQQHSGEHIVSGIVHEWFGYNNVGFHLGADSCTLDFDGPITKEQLKEIERRANGAVFENIGIQVSYPDKEELKSLEYRSKIDIEGQVRIVTVPGYDVCACCAPHVKRTGEIGLIKLVNMMNYKGGERLTMLCGYRALSDYDRKDENSKAISAALCAKETEIAQAVLHLKEEQAAAKGRLASLSQKLLGYLAQEVDVSGDAAFVFDSGLSGNAPRELMNLVLLRGVRICGVFAGRDDSGYRYVIGSHTADVRPLSKRLNDAFAGRGGGKPGMVQGTLTGSEEEIRKLCEEGIEENEKI